MIETVWTDVGDVGDQLMVRRGERRGRNALVRIAVTILAVIAALLSSVAPASAAPTNYGWQGWEDISAGMRTADTPVALNYGTQQWIFVRSAADNRIYLNKGDGSGWALVPGSPSVRGAPAVTTWNANLHIFSWGTDGRVWGNAFNGSQWNGWSPVPDSDANAAPATTVYNNKLYLFRRGTTGYLFYNVYTTNWSGWRQVPGAPSAGQHAPAVAPWHGNLHIFVNSGNTVHGTKYNDSLGWYDWGQVPNSATAAAPAFAADDPLLLAIRRPDSTVWVNDYPYGTNWNGWSQVPSGITPSAPSVLPWRIFIRGTDNHIYRNRSAFELLR